MNLQEKIRNQVTAKTFMFDIQVSTHCRDVAFPMGCCTDNAFGDESFNV